MLTRGAPRRAARGGYTTLTSPQRQVIYSRATCACAACARAALRRRRRYSELVPHSLLNTTLSYILLPYTRYFIIYRFRYLYTSFATQPDSNKGDLIHLSSNGRPRDAVRVQLWAASTLLRRGGGEVAGGCEGAWSRSGDVAIRRRTCCCDTLSAR